ncbi:hypothetical protein BpHYR1_028834 [Brachionus plicatilis]|uniref:Uncharacterized protein n=1 Tax=Brachionus plicatilis TaxID=10195 RepID=A0A3M7PXC1_BRAPC|nr:hypothetical protein BpHYR1_028834 [Brachionus plicatilis]
MNHKNISLENSSLLLNILKSPLPSSPVVLKYSQMRNEKDNLKSTQICSNSSNKSNSLPLPVKRKLDSLKETDQVQPHTQKRRIISITTDNQKSMKATFFSSDTSDSTTAFIPTDSYEYMAFCLRNNPFFFQPAPEFDNFIFSFDENIDICNFD